MAKQVAIQDLTPGMFIVGVIEQNGPVKIRKSGLVTSHEMVQGLSEMGVLSVAIDPEKTVEIELEDAVHVSQTQFVMQANEEKAFKDTDTHLSEQFNRSLFMPSLQKVPSAWQYYGSKTAIAVLVTALGLTSGWFASQAPQLLNGKTLQVVETPAETSPASEVNGSEGIENADDSDVNIEATEEGQETSPQSEVTGNPAVDSVQATDIPKGNRGSSPASQPQVAANSAVGSQNSADSSQFSADGNFNSADGNFNSADGSQIGAIGSDKETSEATASNSFNNSENQVSAELLQRFEKAMADLEQESSVDAEFDDDGETLEYGDQNNDFNTPDVQRVDQLPARVMTRLPKMSFSAHMYASNPRNRWVKVNGVEMGEGEWLDNKVFIERIEPQHVIMIFEDHQFSMRALSEW